MRKFWFYTISCVLLYNSTLWGQTRQLTIEDAVTGSYTYLAPAALSALCWHPESAACYYLEKGKMLTRFDAASKETNPVFSLDNVNEALKLSGHQELGRFLPVEVVSSSVFRLKGAGKMLQYNRISGKIELYLNCDSLGENHDLSPGANAFAYTRENNLFIQRVGEPEVAVTSVLDKNIVSGQTVSRNEFGIEKGTFWSPAGSYLAFYRKDESNVNSYPVVDITTRIASVVHTKYPMAGMGSERVSVGIYNCVSRKTIFIEQDSASDKYLTSVSWSPDEKYIYLGVLNRGQDSLKLNRYEAESGKLVNTLFEENHPRYVEPLHPLYFPGNDPNRILWLSQRDGFMHLYLYTPEGKLLRQLTHGSWIITDFTGMDPAGEFAFLTTTIQGALERQLVKVNIANGKLEQLTREHGTHQCRLSPGGKWIIDVFESVQVPRRISMHTVSGKKMADILIAPDPLKEYTLGSVTLDSLRARDGNTLLHCRYLTPPDYDPLKKYPLIIYVYGGPHAQLVTNGWLGDAPIWDYYMAQQGYIVFTLDNRGSANRGFEFESCIHRQLGKLEMEDQLAGLEWLKRKVSIDTSRIGIFGWSYGGFMTLSLMTTYPGVFRAGIAGGPVTDWKYYEVMYGERYMDRPEENLTGYEASSLLRKADKVQGRLLIIHGALDVTVVWQQSLAFINACIASKKQVDYFVYPNHEHNVRGTDRVHLMTKVTDYFNTYLR